MDWKFPLIMTLLSRYLVCLATRTALEGNIVAHGDPCYFHFSTNGLLRSFIEKVHVMIYAKDYVMIYAKGHVVIYHLPMHVDEVQSHS